MPKRCEDCTRNAIVEVRRKWPGKAMLKFVCGYHKRPYLTSQYTIRHLGTPAPKKPKSYAPSKVYTGYAPVVPTPQGEETCP